MRSKQRDATREHIIKAAMDAIAESGYEGVSTRAIAARAGVAQGLLTYHFKSKDALWQAAADFIFAKLDARLELAQTSPAAQSPQELRRETIRQLVMFGAEHPEMLRFMMDVGAKDQRADWLVETHLRRICQRFCNDMDGREREDFAHLFYIIAGASSLIFSTSSRCQQLSGLDPRAPEAVQRHADILVNLLEP